MPHGHDDTSWETVNAVRSAQKLLNPSKLTAAYTKMTEATTQDLELQTEAFNKTVSPHSIARRAIGMLLGLRGCFIGNEIDMYEHNLQCATRALRGGETEELVVCALLHDIGEAITPNAHGT